MSERAEGPATGRAPLAALRAFVGHRAPLERCELCGTALSPVHPHLARTDARQLLCTCEPCALLFSGNPASAYRRVPRTITRLADFALSDEQWDALMVPIDLAFFFHSTPAGQIVAIDPSPAGPTESLLPLTAWDEILAGHPRLSALEPDVEALLVNRVRRPASAAPRYFVVPIDECYKLVGVMRRSWRGLSGGAEVWTDIATYFAALEARAVVRGASAHA